jgi:hypothetical protein
MNRRIRAMSFQYILRADRPVARWRLYAPPPVRWSLAAAYGLMLVPGILGTVFTISKRTHKYDHRVKECYA